MQVHPDDVYAARLAKGESGKTECRYVANCKEDAKIPVILAKR